ncbi:MAG TPA: SMP-30/gluconolactonase/LRE family protein [Acidobacteriota bacterium]|jgi:gluconolactonase
MDPEIPIERFEIFARGLDHPEGLAFDRQGFLWAGGEAGQIYRIDPDGRVQTAANLGSFCAGLAFSPDDELFVCSSGLGVVRVTASGVWQVFASEAAGIRILCPNHLVFDRRGRLYVSDSGEWQKRNGRLLRFDPFGKAEVIGAPFGYANGLALDAEETHLFMVESDTDRIYRFEVAGDSSLGSGEIYAQAVGRFPDGLALDAEGNLYVCCYASDEIHRIRPTGLKELVAFDRHGILLGSPTNLAFGGATGEEIYVANFGRTTITRAPIGSKGQGLANLRS